MSADANRTLAQLRAQAVGHTLFTPTTLGAALERLAFVQADPIRAPARAEDLILRQRVAGYREGDLSRWYPTAPIEEGYLYAYGTMPRESWDVVRPRELGPLSEAERAVLEVARQTGGLHPRQLDAHFAGERAVNDWGGQSRRAKLVLEHLHWRGLLRIVGREKGVRRYALAPPVAAELAPLERLRRMVLMAARVLAPVREPTLLSMAARFCARIAGRPDYKKALAALTQRGELERAVVDGIAYVWPADSVAPAEPERRVRFLAPFDPVVWDRKRFEHLWQWEYRFEAYTPPAKRVRGYYALPVLLEDRVIGWANASRADGRVQVSLGFAGGAPADSDFRALVDEEVARLEAFLAPR